MGVANAYSQSKVELQSYSIYVGTGWVEKINSRAVIGQRWSCKKPHQWYTREHLIPVVGFSTHCIFSHFRLDTLPNSPAPKGRFASCTVASQIRSSIVVVSSCSSVHQTSAWWIREVTISKKYIHIKWSLILYSPTVLGVSDGSIMRQSWQ